MKEMIINAGQAWYLRDKDGNKVKINKDKAWKLFRTWQAAGLKIRRKYGMNGQVAWIWGE